MRILCLIASDLVVEFIFTKRSMIQKPLNEAKMDLFLRIYTEIKPEKKMGCRIKAAIKDPYVKR